MGPSLLEEMVTNSVLMRFQVYLEESLLSYVSEYFQPTSDYITDYAEVLGGPVLMVECSGSTRVWVDVTDTKCWVIILNKE